MTTRAPSPALLGPATRHSGGRCLVLFLLSIAATGTGLLLPAALGRTLDLLLARDPATRWVLYCASLVLLLALFDACETVLGATVDARTTAWLRRRLTGHVLAVGPRAAARFGPGDLVARLVGNAAQAGTAPTARAALLAALAGPLGATVALALIDPWLAAVFLAGAPVLTLLLRAFARDTSRCVASYQRAQGLIAGALAEAVDGHRTIAAAGTADRETARVLRPLPDLSRAGREMWRVQGRAAGQAVAVAPLLQLGVVAVAGVLLTRHRLSVGEVLAASRYAVLASGVGMLVGRLAALARARAAATRLDEVLAEPAPAHGERRLPAGPGRLELRGVGVRRGGRTVLDGVDLVVPGGTALAVVGRSGTGKSLLAAVAGRLTDPDAGEVLLDGVPLPALARDELRRAVGYAFERPALLGATIADTIGLGPAPPSPARVREAARTARADDFVRRLPEGYATACADAPCSGGEAQRLGLARAFTHGGRLLILDDALSSLDTVTEAHITDALMSGGSGTTRLLVAHRATTAARADLVAWLDAGRLRAVAPHAHLWHDPAYRAAFGSEPLAPAPPTDTGREHAPAEHGGGALVAGGEAAGDASLDPAPPTDTGPEHAPAEHGGGALVAGGEAAGSRSAEGTPDGERAAGAAVRNRTTADQRDRDRAARERAARDRAVAAPAPENDAATRRAADDPAARHAPATDGDAATRLAVAEPAVRDEAVPDRAVPNGSLAAPAPEDDAAPRQAAHDPAGHAPATAGDATRGQAVAEPAVQERAARERTAPDRTVPAPATAGDAPRRAADDPAGRQAPATDGEAPRGQAVGGPV